MRTYDLDVRLTQQQSDSDIKQFIDLIRELEFAGFALESPACMGYFCASGMCLSREYRPPTASLQLVREPGVGIEAELAGLREEQRPIRTVKL